MLSAIIATHESERTLVPTLSALVPGATAGLIGEVVVADAGSTDATAEVERYIAMPAQALSYKIGALTIQRLRAKAENALGPRFDIRAFHEQVLGSGALPLPVLEAKIDGWIAAQR